MTACGGGGASSSGTSIALGTPYTLSFQVTDGGGHAVTGADITLATSDGSKPPVTSKGSGVYEISTSSLVVAATAATPLKATITAPNFKPQTVTFNSVSEFASAKPVALEAVVPYTLNIQVTDSGGIALTQGVSVKLSTSNGTVDGAASTTAGLYVVSTNDVSIPDPSVAPVYVTVTATSFEPALIAYKSVAELTSGTPKSASLTSILPSEQAKTFFAYTAANTAVSGAIRVGNNQAAGEVNSQLQGNAQSTTATVKLVASNGDWNSAGPISAVISTTSAVSISAQVRGVQCGSTVEFFQRVDGSPQEINLVSNIMDESTTPAFADMKTSGAVLSIDTKTLVAGVPMWLRFTSGVAGICGTSDPDDFEFSSVKATFQ